MTVVGRNRLRERNASAWLLPHDGTRTNHGLRRDMCRYDPADEVDLVVVGCGGGSVLTRVWPAEAGES